MNPYAQTQARWNQIAQVFKQEGIPVNVWQPIALAEGGGVINPNAVGDNNTSFGELQLHIGGQLPPSWAASAKRGYGPAFNPTDNAIVGSIDIAKAYKQGLKLGYRGLKLTQYVASHSGHPAFLPKTVLENSATMPEATAIANYYKKYGNSPGPVAIGYRPYNVPGGNSGATATGFTSSIGTPKVGPTFPKGGTWNEILIMLYQNEQGMGLFGVTFPSVLSIFGGMIGLTMIAVGIITVIGIGSITDIASLAAAL